LKQVLEASPRSESSKRVLKASPRCKNPADNDGWTPLHWAAENGQLEIVKLLLEHAEDKNPANKERKRKRKRKEKEKTRLKITSVLTRVCVKNLQ
jgi:ankyrin repeat protein